MDQLKHDIQSVMSREKSLNRFGFGLCLLAIMTETLSSMFV